MALTKLTFLFRKALKLLQISLLQRIGPLERNSQAWKPIEVFGFVISAISQKFSLELSRRAQDRGQLKKLSILGRRMEKKSQFPLLLRSAVRESVRRWTAVRAAEGTLSHCQFWSPYRANLRSAHLSIPPNNIYGMSNMWEWCILAYLYFLRRSLWRLLQTVIEYRFSNCLSGLCMQVLVRSELSQ